jgi:polysaccharide deacetylase 2 family uncharacterized protein YibQ
MAKKRDASGPRGRGRTPARFNYALVLPALGAVLLAGLFLVFGKAPDSPAPVRAVTLRLPEKKAQKQVVAHAASTRRKSADIAYAIRPALAAPAPVPGLAARPAPEADAENAPGTVPEIAIVIDDCGPSEAGTKGAIALPAAFTLSFLPYPDASLALSHRAHLAGHEVILHLPMQPLGKENPGPMALMTGLDRAELLRRVDWALARVSDFDGVNNHMGSRFTGSRADLVPVMEELSAHRLFFLDSRTGPGSLGQTVAREAGMLAGGRDVFLDDVESLDAVAHQLSVTESRARLHGSAIAIGHPHPATLAALADWAAGVEARGFRLVALRTVLERRSHGSDSQTAAR